MAILLALLTACVYGTADYLGGRATRSVSAVVVTFVGQFFGMIVLLVLAVTSGIPAPAAGDWAWSALAGIVGSTGLLAFYSAMSAGYMTVVAPVAAVMNALVPIVAGFAQGERPGGLVLVGIPLAIFSIALISDVLGPGHHRAPARVVLLAATGGSMFGLILVALHQTSSDSGIWPVLIMRLFSTPLMALLVVLTRQRVTSAFANKGTVIGSGVLDSLANWFYVLAVRRGLLSVVAVIVTLYPGSTMLLAMGLDRERIHRSQVLGVVLAGVALVLIALG